MGTGRVETFIICALRFPAASSARVKAEVQALYRPPFQICISCETYPGEWILSDLGQEWLLPQRDEAQIRSSSLVSKTEREPKQDD